MSKTNSYGLCELARELGLPESTTRYYRDVFAQFIPSDGLGRKRRYPEEALEKLRYIAGAFSEGRTREEIARTLACSGALDHAEDPPAALTAEFVAPQPTSDQIIESLLDGEREQRELMWQMVRELSRFGDAIERQHHILTNLVDHAFPNIDRRLPAAENGDEVENVVDADIISESDQEEERFSPEGDVENLRKALESERELVDRLRQSKLDLERRAVAAEAELERAQEQESGLLRRLFDRNRGL